MNRRSSNGQKEKIISTAFNLFISNGVHAVGINRVISESGVAKKPSTPTFQVKKNLLQPQWNIVTCDTSPGYNHASKK
jgi:hypothetical protein